jgi:N-glycosidase YbiA
MTDLIYNFTGDYRFLSNFWPCQVMLDRLHYPSVEHAYQAAKTVHWAERAFIRKQCPKPGDAKSFGKLVTMRPDWDAIKLDVMGDLLRQKFAPFTPLAERLLATGDAKLVEGNTWGDTFWGRCRGKGKNHLGNLLMTIRQELKDTHHE